MFNGRRVLFALAFIILALLLFSTQATAADNITELEVKSISPHSFGKQSMEESPALVASYPSGTFLYYVDYGWGLLTPSIAYAMAYADITGNGYLNFIGSFDSGTWYLDDRGNWALLTGAKAISLASAHGGDLFASFPSGTWLYHYDSGWIKLTSAVASDLTFAYVVDNGIYDLVANYDSGTWYAEFWWDVPHETMHWRWERITHSQARALIGYIDGGNESLLHFIFPSGFWDYFPMTGRWHNQGHSAVTAMAVADMNKDNYPNLITTSHEGTFYLQWYEKYPGEWHFKWTGITDVEAISMQGINIYPFDQR